MGRILLSICAVVVAVGLTGSAQPMQPQQQAPAANQPAKATEKARNQRPPVMITLAEPNGERQGDHQSTDSDGDQPGPSPWYDLWAQSLMALWAFLQLILTGVGIWYIRKTLIETEKAVTDTGKATAAMVKANEIANDSTRAWVMLDRIERSVVEQAFHKGHHVTDGLEFGFDWINAGAVPALGCRFCNMYLFFPKTLPPLVFEPKDTDPTGQTIGPGRKHGSGYEMILNDEQTAQFRAQTHRLLLYSRVQYFATLADAVAGGPLKTTEICYEGIYVGTVKKALDGPEIDSIVFLSFGPQQTVT